ncbi:MAG: hypothetical protein HQL51_04010 [Magnetococcales bacterium]|nr:hypothetical protein [Magnetococcales bacterium]
MTAKLGVVASVVLVVSVGIAGMLWNKSVTTDKAESTDASNVLDRLADREMKRIVDKVAEDAVAQYRIARRQGDKIQICVQAGFVSAAFLQAKEETKYNDWKEIEKINCETAGIPR